MAEGQKQNKRPPTLCVDFLLMDQPVSLFLSFFKIPMEEYSQYGGKCHVVLVILLYYSNHTREDGGFYVQWYSKTEWQISEPRHEKTNILVSDLVPHKPGCTSTEDDWRLEILYLESRWIVLSM